MKISVKKLRKWVLTFAQLPCSYSSQFRNGLLTPPAYRKILRALKTAVDHANDTDVIDIQQLIDQRRLSDVIRLSDMMFEWGWLQLDGFLDLPRWLQLVRALAGGEDSVKRKCLFGAICVAPLIKSWTIHEM